MRSFGKLNQFKMKIISFIRPKENSVFKIHGANGIKLLNRIRLHFSHLNEHNLRHNFRVTIGLMWSCCLEPEQHSKDLIAELLNDICALNITLKDASMGHQVTQEGIYLE